MERCLAVANSPIASCAKNAHAPIAMRYVWEKTPSVFYPTDDFFKNLRLVDIQRVGRYAVRLAWSDGHRTGIYTFEFLRELSEGVS